MIFIGTSGVLGRFVPIAAPAAIWWRAAIGCLLIGGYCWYQGARMRIPDAATFKAVLLSGVLMTAHWVTYFYALKLSSVAIGMLAIFTYPAMTTLLEPLLLNKPFVARHILLAGLVVIGVYLLAPELSFSNEVTVGLGLGLLSALIFSLRNILVKSRLQVIPGSVVMLYQTLFAAVSLVPVWWLYDALPTWEAVPYLVGLGLFTTAIGHTLFLACFQYFSVSSVSLMSCIQPVYGILLGVIFFREYPDLAAMGGGVLILAAVVIESLALKRPQEQG